MVHLRTNHSFMLKGILKKLIFVFVVMFSSLFCFAQQYHFVYLQADNQQPFYVKYGAKNYSSSSIGYLILPKLSDGSFSIQVGFPKNLYPEQTFNLSVAGKDLGFALKNFADKGWGLFNFQTTDIVMNVNASEASEAITKPAITTNKANPFGNMLADAINDSTLNQQSTAVTDTAEKVVTKSSSFVPKDTLLTAVNNQPSVDSNSTVLQASTSLSNKSQGTSDSEVKNSANVDSLSVKNVTSDAAGNIIKSSENVTTKGTDFTFLDNAGKDTIHAFIPSEDSITADTSVKEKTDNPFFKNGDTDNINKSQFATTDTASGTIANSSLITNSNCQKMFSTYDADKLKKKIISLHNQDDILAAIKKSLHEKCVTTEQVKDLSNLFLSDENRYNFYDAVFPNVSDVFNLPQLQNTLIDTYYKNRFKALLH